MRVSTGQIHDAAVLGMERSQSQLVKLQNQISSQRRMLTPADDPVGAARALTITQSRAVIAQYAENQATASDRLGLVDSQLSAVTELVQNVRSRVVQAGNTVLSDSDRQAIAVELEQRFDELLGIANSRNAAGDYLFSGYQSESKPFARQSAAAGAGAAVAYFGDNGERLVQGAASQQMATSVAGSELFMNIRTGNGSFSTAAGSGGAANQGTGIIDGGSVLDQQKWQDALNTDFPWQGAINQDLQIVFSSVGGVSSYQLFDASTAAPPGAALPPLAVSEVLPFVPGQAIALLTTAQPPAPAQSTDFGAQVVIIGEPAAGDSFSITPGGNTSIFQTMQDLIGLLRAPLASSTDRTEFSGQLAGHLSNLDQGQANVSRVQSSVGARLQALDALSDNAAAVDVLYQQTLSDLQDLDYAKAISDFTRQQLSLEAAQKSYVTISGLSLFNYI